MFRVIIGISLICLLYAPQSWCSEKCAKKVEALFLKAKWQVNPSDSDFQAANAGVRLRAHLILTEELDPPSDKIWWQPRAQYFKAMYHSKSSEKAVRVLFNKEEGLWAYQVEGSGLDGIVCIYQRGISEAYNKLMGKK